MPTKIVGPGGGSMELDERIADVLQRHGPDSPSVHPQRGRYLQQVEERMRSRLR